MNTDGRCATEEELQTLLETTAGRAQLLRHAGRCDPCRELLALLCPSGKRA